MVKYGHISDVALISLGTKLDDLLKALESVGTDNLRVKSV